MCAIQIISLSFVAFSLCLIVFYRLSEKRSNQGSKCPWPQGRAGLTFPVCLELRLMTASILMEGKEKKKRRLLLCFCPYVHFYWGKPVKTMTTEPCYIRSSIKIMRIPKYLSALVPQKQISEKCHEFSPTSLPPAWNILKKHKKQGQKNHCDFSSFRFLCSAHYV